MARARTGLHGIFAPSRCWEVVGGRACWKRRTVIGCGSTRFRRPIQRSKRPAISLRRARPMASTGPWRAMRCGPGAFSTPASIHLCCATGMVGRCGTGGIIFAAIRAGSTSPSRSRRTVRGGSAGIQRRFFQRIATRGSLMAVILRRRIFCRCRGSSRCIIRRAIWTICGRRPTVRGIAIWRGSTAILAMPSWLLK